MARKKGRRDTNEIANDPLSDLLSQPLPLPPVTLTLPEPLTLLEDRRLFHPLQDDAHPIGLQRDDSRVVLARPRSLASAKLPTYPNAKVAFNKPSQTAVCVRREQRREVLFAKGKGGGRHRAPRRNWRSDIKC